MTAPTRPAGGIDANVRGIAVLVGAVVIGLLLLFNVGSDDDATAVSTTDTTSTTVDTSGIGGGQSTTSAVDGVTTAPTSATATTATTATTSPQRQPGEVSVVVLNADGPPGSAGAASETIGAAGYQMGAPGNANADVTLDTSAVYFAEGFQAEATAVAMVLGKASEAVQALPQPAPGPGAEASNVVVVLGKDTAPASGADDATTTTTTG